VIKEVMSMREEEFDPTYDEALDTDPAFDY